MKGKRLILFAMGFFFETQAVRPKVLRLPWSPHLATCFTSRLPLSVRLLDSKVDHFCREIRFVEQRLSPERTGYQFDKIGRFHISAERTYEPIGLSWTV
jgi:hypothetical protein